MFAEGPPVSKTPVGCVVIGLGLLAILAIMSVISCPGCSAFQNSSPQQKYAAANDTFIAAVQVLITARQTGEFTQEEWRGTILPLINAGSALLDGYRNLTKAGLEDRGLLRQLQGVLTALQPFIARTQEPTP